MRIDSLLRVFTSLQVERPPELWEVDGDEKRVADLLVAMLSAVRETGANDDIVLNVSNVVVEPPDDGEEMLAPAIGEYIAVTMLTTADLGPDATWHPDKTDVDGVLFRILPLLRNVSRYAYIRWVPPRGSVTVFLPRKS